MVEECNLKTAKWCYGHYIYPSVKIRNMHEDDLCEEVMQYLRRGLSVENILANILRDILLNELIYISYTNKWCQYKIREKKWCIFDPKTLLNKIPVITHFLENDLQVYIDKGNTADKYLLKKQLANIIHYVYNKFCEKKFLQQCIEFFKVP